MSTTLSLSDLCVPSHTKPYLAAPTAYTLPGGTVWSVATDARAMLCVRGRVEGCACREAGPEDDGPLGLLLRLSSSPLGDPIDMTALRAWAGEYDPWINCKECDGEGEIYCEACENHGRCRECKGEGGWGGDVRPGMVRGFCLDRNVLAKFLRHWTELAARFNPQWYQRQCSHSTTRMAALVGENQALLIAELDPASQYEPIVPFEE